MGSIPGSGRSPGEGNGNPLQYFSLGKPVDRGAWHAAIHGVAKVLDTDLATEQQQQSSQARDWNTIAIKLGLKLSITPWTHRGAKPTSSPLTASGQLLEQRWARPMLEKSHPELLPGCQTRQLLGARETTPVGSELPEQHKRKTVLQQSRTLPCSRAPLPTAPA